MQRLKKNIISFCFVRIKWLTSAKKLGKKCSKSDSL